MDCIQLSLFGKMCPEHSVPTKEKISELCWKNLPALNNQTLLFLDLRGGADGAKREQSAETDGLWLGDSLTLNIGECPREENVSLLSQILEDNVPQKYYLSATATLGILRRAAKRGKELPLMLETALVQKTIEGEDFGQTEIENARKILRTVRETIGAENTKKWVRAALLVQQETVLQCGVCEQTEDTGRMPCVIGELDKGTCEENCGGCSVCGLWKDLQDGSASHRRESIQQLAGELGSLMQKLPLKETQNAVAMYCLRTACKSEESLHEALPAAQKRDAREDRGEKPLGHFEPSIPPWKTATRATQNSAAGDDRVVGNGCYCIAGNIVDRSETAGANGVGATENVSYTLNTVDRHAVAYSFDSLASNSMKSSNPYSGCREVELARTLDTSIPDPSKNQGGIAIVEPVAYTMKIRSGREGGGKGALVQTEKSATLSTLQDQTLFQPVVYDARGNGDGKIVPTITGDHESRITDYTAIVTERRTFSEQSFSHYKESDKCAILKAKAGNIGNGSESLVAEKAIRWIVRRLTPVECERLQGYPDRWTDIGEWTDTKGKKHKPADTPRYKALGNSIALPQWFWIAQKMRPYLKENPTLGSLFDGLGGFPLVWQRAYGEGTARWASEVDNFCIAITRKRFPDVEES